MHCVKKNVRKTTVVISEKCVSDSILDKLYENVLCTWEMCSRFKNMCKLHESIQLVNIQEFHPYESACFTCMYV